MPALPVFIEAALVGLGGYALGLGLAYLAALHRRRASRNWGTTGHD